VEGPGPNEARKGYAEADTQTDVGGYGGRGARTGAARHSVRNEELACVRALESNEQHEPECVYIIHSLDVFIISRDVHAFTTSGEVGRRAKRWKDQGGAQVGAHGRQTRDGVGYRCACVWWSRMSSASSKGKGTSQKKKSDPALQITHEYASY
jgi:hypothetical protein